MPSSSALACSDSRAVKLAKQSTREKPLCSLGVLTFSRVRRPYLGFSPANFGDSKHGALRNDTLTLVLQSYRLWLRICKYLHIGSYVRLRILRYFSGVLTNTLGAKTAPKLHRCTRFLRYDPPKGPCSTDSYVPKCLHIHFRGVLTFSIQVEKCAYIFQGCLHTYSKAKTVPHSTRTRQLRQRQCLRHG